MIVRRNLFDNGLTRVNYASNSRKKKTTLVVTFANLGDNITDETEDKASFGEKLFLSLGYNVLTFRKRRENWYQDLSADECEALARDVIAPYRRVVTYGSSMGAYAALYFSGALRANAILATSPQCSVDPLFPAPNSPYLNKVTFRHGRIREVANRKALPLVLYDPMVRRDRLYIDREILPAFKRYRGYQFRYSGHPTGEVLAELKLLKDVVVPLAKTGSFDTADINARYRAARRESIHYLFNLTQVALDKNRPHLALRFIDEAFRLYELRHAEKPNTYVLGKITRMRDRALTRLAEAQNYRAAV